MKKTVTACAVVCAMTLGSGLSTAGAEETGFGLGVGVSTLGLTVEPRYRVNETFGVRAPIGFASYSTEDDFDGNDFAGDVRLGGLGLLADYYLPVGGLRVSGGAFISNYRVSAEASGELDIDGVTYADAEIDGRIRARNRISPMLTVGADIGNLRGWSFSSDLGVIFTRLEGRFRGTESTGDPDFPDRLQNYEDDLNDELRSLKALPYLSVQATFRF